MLRVPSKEYAQFKREFEALSLSSELKGVRAWCKEEEALGIHFTFFFPLNRLFTLDGRIKKLDASNRVKAAQDALASMLEIDDSKFFEVSAKKLVGPKEEMKAELYRVQIKTSQEPASEPGSREVL